MVFIRIKYVYSVIPVIDKRLTCNTKKWTLVRSWLIRVRLVHSWAETKKASKCCLQPRGVCFKL